MIFCGITREFSTKNEQQYDTIGAFWDEMSDKYGLENLRGLGYGWTEDTIRYAIGLKEGVIDGANCEMELPDEGWVKVNGRTSELSRIYDDIYADGRLDLEIETFTDNGDCEILYYRKNKQNKIRLFMAGDALIHDAVYNDALCEDGTYDLRPMLQYIKPLASRCDLAYYNQETILGGTDLGLSTYPRFNSPQETGDAFIDAGFNLVSLANNHTMDMDEEGVIRSVDYWKKHEDKVVVSGQWTSSEDRVKDTGSIHTINGIRYAFLAYTMWTNELETPPGKEYLSNVYSDEKAAEDIARIRGKADIIIVAMHWGLEYALVVFPEQKRVAKYLSDLGVQLIIGSHPHVVQPVEYINDGKTFVIYSLGNLLSNQEGLDKRTGLMMSVDICKREDSSGKPVITIEDPRAELVFNVSSRKGRRGFRLYPYHMLSDEIFPGYRALEDYREIVSSQCSELRWGLKE